MRLQSYALPLQYLTKQGREELLPAAVEPDPSNSSCLIKRNGRGCPLLRASNDMHDPSKLARFLSRDGG